MHQAKDRRAPACPYPRSRHAVGDADIEHMAEQEVSFDVHGKTTCANLAENTTCLIDAAEVRATPSINPRTSLTVCAQSVHRARSQGVRWISR